MYIHYVQWRVVCSPNLVLPSCLEDLPNLLNFVYSSCPVQGFIRLVAHVGSSDPVRVLHLYTTITLDEVCSIYC